MDSDAVSLGCRESESTRHRTPPSRPFRDRAETRGWPPLTVTEPSLSCGVVVRSKGRGTRLGMTKSSKKQRNIFKGYNNYQINLTCRNIKYEYEGFNAFFCLSVSEGLVSPSIWPEPGERSGQTDCDPATGQLTEGKPATGRLMERTFMYLSSSILSVM